MKLAILDKDGTLVRPISGAQFVQHPHDQELLPGVKEAIQRLVDAGYVLAIASNQGGVAAGFKTLDDAIKEMEYCMQLTGIDNACMAHSNEKWYGEMISLYKPENISETMWNIHTHKDMRFRKPAPGMLHAAICWGWMDEVTEAIMIGDRPEDKGAATAASIPFIDAEQWRSGKWMP